MGARDLLKRSARLRLLVRRLRAEAYAFPRWRPILDASRDVWETARAARRNGPPVLIATGVGGHPYAVILESLLGVALTLRGADVRFLLCDSALPACELAEYTWFPDVGRFARHGPQAGLCGVCFAPARTALEPLGLPVHRYSDFLTAEDRGTIDRLAGDVATSDIEGFKLDGLAVGEHARAGALRFYARGDIADERHAEAVLRRYFRAALITTCALRRLLTSEAVRTAVFQHGIYVPQGLVGEVCRERGVRVVNWNVAYRRQRFIFSHGDTYHHTMMSEPVDLWDRLEVTPALNDDVMDYLESRRKGSRDWIWFHERPLEDIDAIAQELGVDFSRPWVGMLTNVFWDAQLHYHANAFPTMLDWVVDTIDYFVKRPELILIVRIHPAELRGTLPSRQPLLDEIRRRFPQLPENIRLIPPESQISTYAAMSQCNAVVIYGTKTGVELAARGIPVIVAGEAWIRGKGISLDASTRADYFDLLDRLPLTATLDPATVERARRYAYHFFFRRMIPVEAVTPRKGWLPYELGISSVEECLPGRSAGLDVICDGILNGTEFVYPEEQKIGRPR